MSPPGTSYFLDTGIWDESIEPRIWAALSAIDRKVFVVPGVREELRSWVERHPNHPGSVAIKRAETTASSMVVLPPLEQGGDRHTAYTYYVSLLHLRRRALDVARLEFVKREGRAPESGELVAIAQQAFGQRGLLLTHKYGKSPSVDPNATDESLVYLAAEHALSKGSPTVILTKDQDVVEQFYKLWWFLDTHYRGMLMAKEYERDPLRYPHLRLPDGPRQREVFDPTNGFLLERGTERMQAVLPSRFSFVSVECWLIGKAMTRLTFGAEMRMHDVIKVKGATGGLVSDGLLGRNLHPWLAPLPLETRLRSCAAIVHDRSVNVRGTRANIGMLDIHHSMLSLERFTSLSYDLSKPKSLLWTPSVESREKR
jgi:hypothetical protein